VARIDAGRRMAAFSIFAVSKPTTLEALEVAIWPEAIEHLVCAA
jgi:hypothetical protein